MANHTTYRRADGVEGVGYEIEFAGRRQHSVAWPDRPAERFLTDELARRGIKRDGEPVQEPVESHETPPVEASEPAKESHEAPSVDGTSEPDPPPIAEGLSEAEAIRRYLAAHPDAENDDVIRGVAEHGYEVQSSQVTRQRNKLAK